MAARPRVLLIHNPAAGRARAERVAAVVACLARRGFAVSLRATERAGHAAQLAAEAGDADIIIAAGGDGTVNEIAGGLGDPAPAIAVLPLGTANVLAAELGMSAEPERFVASLAAGRCVVTRPGLMNGRRFLLMAGIGFDAAVVAAVSPACKRWLGKGAYGLAALGVWLAGRRSALRLNIDGEARRAASLIVCRSRYYGGRFVLAPEAGIAAPRLVAVLLPGGRRRDLLRYAWAMLRGRLAEVPGVELLPAHRIRVESDTPAPMQLDGDAAGSAPAEIALDTRPLRLMVG